MARPLLLRILFTLLLAASLTSSQAQDTASQASLLADKREMEERYKRLNAAYEDLVEAFGVQQKRMERLVDEINKLREENAQLAGKLSNFATRDDLRKLAEKLQEVDNKREADKKLILEEIQRLAKVAASTPPPVIEKRPSNTKSIEPNENFISYTVHKGDTLSGIVKIYNSDLKEKGLPSVTMDQVRKANPKLRADVVVVGSEILLPVPSK